MNSPPLNGLDDLDSSAGGLVSRNLMKTLAKEFHTACSSAASSRLSSHA